MFFHSSLADSVLFIIGRNYTTHVTGHTSSREILTIYYDPCHFINMDYGLRFECTFPVSSETVGASGI